LANTELNYVKKRIKELENDIAAFGRILIDAGIVEVEVENGEFSYKVSKVKLEEVQDGKPTDGPQ
jgi:hypothetical protein